MGHRLFLFATLGLGLLSSAGCQKYFELKNTSDRIWMISQDHTQVFRCWDLKNQTGKLIAVCRHAEMLGTNEGSANAEQAEKSAAPAHPDSTELVPIFPAAAPGR